MEEEIIEKEPHLDDIFGLDDWDLYREFAIENDYVIKEIAPIITEEETIRQFQVVEKEPHIPTYEEQKQNRANSYQAEVDPITSHIQRLRDEEEPDLEKIAELIAERDAKVLEIQERYPYPEEQ